MLAPKPRWRRRLALAAQLSLGLALGLGLTELAFSLRAQDAFPHVNFYVADAELGARLRPHASMGFLLADNPRSQIHVNAQGYRGADWPAPGEAGPELLTIGDSQVFGLGVEDDESFSAQLAELSGRTVLNGGVPTYGPPEYLALTRELLEQREGQVETVVYVLNFLNDPFEIELPNPARHAIWDGWAVRIETAPASVLAFPGRRWLMSQSHTVYAARRWWHSRDQAWFEQVDQGLPSEGEWTDLVVAEPSAPPPPEPPPEPQPAAEPVDHSAEIGELEQRLDKLERELERAKDDANYRRLSDARVLEAKPGGIIRDRHSESKRSITVTADMYNKALARQHERKRAKAELKRLQRRDEAMRAHLERLESAEPPPEPAGRPPAPPAPPAPPRSVFHDHFVELDELCEAHGAELIVVLLPFDVQVDPREWLKYGIEDGEDMSATLELLTEVGEDARALGIEVLDATPALREASPGAFLDEDIHMTPKGHAALAVALAERLEAATSSAKLKN